MSHLEHQIRIKPGAKLKKNWQQQVSGMSNWACLLLAIENKPVHPHCADWMGKWVVIESHPWKLLSIKRNQFQVHRHIHSPTFTNLKKKKCWKKEEKSALRNILWFHFYDFQRQIKLMHDDNCWKVDAFWGGWENFLGWENIFFRWW